MAHFNFLLLTSYLLLISFNIAFSSISRPRPKPKHYPPVLDVKGNKVMLGEPYYVLSGQYMKPAGLCLHPNKKDDDQDVIRCPFNSRNTRSTAVIFTDDEDYVSKDDIDLVVREENFYFVEVFVPDDEDLDGAGWYLKDGQRPNQMAVGVGDKSLMTRFSTKKVFKGYKMSYCAPIPVPHIPICYVLGFSMDNYNNGYNKKLLPILGFGVGVPPVQFFFKKADDFYTARNQRLS